MAFQYDLEYKTLSSQIVDKEGRFVILTWNTKRFHLKLLIKKEGSLFCISKFKVVHILF